MFALVTIFFTSFVIAFSGALMPGPLLTVTISESPRRGSGTGPLLIVGHGLLEMALVSAIFLGMAPLLKQPGVFAAIAFSGAAILLWMAWGMFRTLPTLRLKSDPGKAAGHSLIVTGILMSLANPYWIVWWVTFGLGYVLQSSQQGPWGVVFFFAGHILADFVWYTAVSTAIAKGRRLLTDRLYRRLTGVCAGFLILFALYFCYAAVVGLIAP